MNISITPNTTVYYINLDDNIKRRNLCNLLLDYLGFKNITRFSAIDTRTMEKAIQYKNIIDPKHFEILKNDIKSQERTSHESLTLGAIGCILSHIGTYKKIIDNNNACALIFEDDITTELSREQFWKIVNACYIPKNTDIYLLDAVYYGVLHLKNTPTIMFGRFMCMHAYMITNKCARILCDTLLPIQYQLDFQIAFLGSAHIINMYGYYGRRIIKQNRNFLTQIQNIHCPASFVKNYDDKVESVKKRFCSKYGTCHIDSAKTQYYSEFGSRDDNSYIYIIFIIVLFIIVILCIIFYVRYKKRALFQGFPK